MSVFERFIYRQLRATKPDGEGWSAKFLRILEQPELLDSLNEVGRLGGDRNFVLFTLVDYRWRRMTPQGNLKERNRLVRSIDALIAAGEESDVALLLTADQEKWSETVAGLQYAKDQLLAMKHYEQGPFHVRFTRRSENKKILRSQRATQCLVKLNRHLKDKTRPRRFDRRSLLGRLLWAFGYIPKTPTDLARWVEKRLERANKKQLVKDRDIEREFIWTFHRCHTAAGTRCGPACALTSTPE
jgi:hypothetical protein